MVQRKAPQKLSPQPETKRSHVKLERQSPSSHHQKEGTQNKGVGDLKKKMKLERSMRAAIDLPNYMKPTTSWDKKKEQVQITSLHSSNSTNLNSSKPSILKKKMGPLVKKNLRGVALNRPTCSSTLKDSKFPKAVDLNHGGTEAEGTSVMKVCPYTYCSLNGHRHDDLPPLKCFVAAKRKLIKTQKSMKLKALHSFRIKSLGKNKVESDTGQRGISKASACLDITHDDVCVEIYTSKPGQQQITNETRTRTEDEEGDQVKEGYSKAMLDNDGDKSSEISNEEMDPMLSFLEYVECDQEVKNTEVERIPILVPRECEEPQDEFHMVDELSKDGEDMLKRDNEASSSDFEGKEEIENLFPDSTTECSDVDEEDGVFNRDANQEVEEEEEEDNDGTSPLEELPIEPSVVREYVVDGGNLEGSEGEELCRVDALDQTSKAQDSDSSEENDRDKMNFRASEEVVAEQPEQNNLKEQRNVLKESVKEEENGNEVGTCSLTVVHLFDAVQVKEEEADDRIKNEEDAQEFGCQGETEDASMDKLKARFRTTKKKITDESDAIRDFNPRSPRFLDEEPDPEAETVDLRHQTMDERKNSEEWMIDYALQQAVTKLAPARKKKVALLVEAFEAVIPLPTHEKPLQHDAASGFLNGRFMQACS